jgi:hypothetical protein
MTVNESLYHFRLFDEFDNALTAEEKEKLYQKLMIEKL